MSDHSAIQWTDATWNPVMGCTRVFSGIVRTVESALEIPLRWKKPRRIFVNSMSDLFHKAVPFEFIDRVFAVMALCPRHVFQLLTKRPERMQEYLADAELRKAAIAYALGTLCASDARRIDQGARVAEAFTTGTYWPLPNVWLGTSCEDQATADDRIPRLLRCPAALRFVSAEPLLGPIDIERAMAAMYAGGGVRSIMAGNTLMPRIDWVIIGGESGPGARPCAVEWIRGIVDQCAAASVPCFVKQLGSKPFVDHSPEPAATLARQCGIGPLVAEFFELRHPKGGDPAEWPDDLRVREFPAT